MKELIRMVDFTVPGQKLIKILAISMIEQQENINHFGSYGYNDRNNRKLKRYTS